MNSKNMILIGLDTKIDQLPSLNTNDLLKFSSVKVPKN